MSRIKQVFCGYAISLLMCCSAVQGKFNEQETINIFNQVCWRIMVNNKIVDADNSNWITAEKYNESIIKVIGKAIADCITENNEFANKKAGDVVTFTVTPKKLDYSDANWNAVILYNYLHELKEDYKVGRGRGTEEVFCAVSR